LTDTNPILHRHFRFIPRIVGRCPGRDRVPHAWLTTTREVMMERAR
jgi:hypothetical protein